MKKSRVTVYLGPDEEEKLRSVYILKLNNHENPSHYGILVEGLHMVYEKEKEKERAFYERRINKNGMN